MTTRPVHFGYNPPSSDRQLTPTPMPTATFPADVERAMGLAIDGGFDSIWISDHVMSADRYRLEAWTMLTWVATRHPGMTIGTTVLADGFRHPPLLAKAVATMSALTGSRMILGYGAGWEETEYRAYGYEFLPARDRVERMEESLEVMRALWQGGPLDHTGRFHRLEGAVGNPVPVPAPLIMVGGESLHTIEVAVRRADWWNMTHKPARIRRCLDRVEEACARAGRDPSTIGRSVYLVAYLADTEARARLAAGARLDSPQPPFAGTPEGLADYLRALVAQGFDAFQMVFPDFPGTRDIELFVERTLPAFR